MNSSLESWTYGIIWKLIQTYHPNHPPSFSSRLITHNTETIDFFYTTELEKWTMKFTKSSLDTFMLCSYERSLFFLCVLVFPSALAETICEYGVEMPPFVHRSAQNHTLLHLIEQIVPIVIANIICNYYETSYRACDELPPAYSPTFLPDKWIKCEEVPGLPQEDSPKNKNQFMTWLIKLQKKEKIKKVNCMIMSIYEEETILPWRSVYWYSDMVCLMDPEAGSLTLLHTQNEKNDTIEYFWVGLVCNGVLIIKASRDCYYGYGSDRYSFDFITQSGQHIQKSLSFDGGFPRIATVPGLGIVIYTSHDMYVRTNFLERVASLRVKDLVAIEYNSKFDFRCYTKEKIIYFINH